jgi:hypothetical protein
MAQDSASARAVDTTRKRGVRARWLVLYQEGKNSKAIEAATPDGFKVQTESRKL